MLTRIGILGLGGVGGYFGGLLAKAYAESDQFEIVFIARGETKKKSNSGLTIITDENEITVFPNIVSDDPLTIGKLDYLICATKTYI
jgi:2-dehydropantoate 2-reductase